MTTTISNTRTRLERVFETLKKQDITPILMLTGSTGTLEDNVAEYRIVARAACTPDAWVGAHAGAEETGGAHWVDGGLYHAATGHDVHTLWFSYAEDWVADELIAALEEYAFYADKVGTEVRLIIQEDDDE